MVRVGVIGLGKMGLPIAVNLMERGFDVTGYRRSGSAELAAAGGTVAGSAAEVAASADVLLSIVPGAEDVEEIICGPAGTLTALRPGTIHIEMSTIDVPRKARIREAVVKSGGDLLDCPISGSPGMVAPRLATTFASVGLHRRVRHRRAAEVHRQPAARRAHRGRRGGDGAGPGQRPGPGARAAHPGQLDRELGHLEAARPDDGRTCLVSRAGPDPDPAPDP